MTEDNVMTMIHVQNHLLENYELVHYQVCNMSNWLHKQRIPKEVDGITSAYYNSISTAENYQYN